MQNNGVDQSMALELSAQSNNYVNWPQATLSVMVEYSERQHFAYHFQQDIDTEYIVNFSNVIIRIRTAVAKM